MKTPKTPESPALKTPEVIQQEFTEINKQRDARFGEGHEPRLSYPVEETSEEDYLKAPVGLSFSGGGIRSATFNLGLLQGMREAGLLKFFDYLSTVSGGGYIGSWFTATNYRLAQAAQDQKATEEQKKKAEALLTNHDYLGETETRHGSPFIHHLRKFSRYLAPKAGITSGDTWAMISIWARNTFLVQIMVIAILVLLMCLVTALPFLFRNLVVISPGPNYELCGQDNAYWWLLVILQMLCLIAAVAISYLGIRSVDTWNEETQGGDPAKLAKAKKKFGAKPMLCWASTSLLLLIGSFIASVLIYRMLVDGDPIVGGPVDQGPFAPAIGRMVLIVALVSLWLCRRGTLENPHTSISEMLLKDLPIAALIWGAYEGLLHWTSVTGLVVAALVSLVGLLFCYLSPDNPQGAAPTKTAKLKNWLCLFLALTFGLAFQWFAGMGLIWGVYELMDVIIGNEVGVDRREMILHDSTAISWISILGPLLIMGGYCLIMVLAIGTLGGRMKERIREWWGRAGAWMLMTGTLYALATLVGIAGPVVVLWVYSKLGDWMGSTLILGWVATAIGAVLAGKSSRSSGQQGSGAATDGLAADLPLFFLLGLMLAVSWGVYWALLPTRGEAHSFLMDAYGLASTHRIWPNWWMLLGAAAFIAIPLILLLDLNLFSMNPFYRNRLERCYLGGTRFADDRQAHPVTGFDFGDETTQLGDDMRLADFVDTANKKAKYPGPYPIINTAINTGASAGNDVQDRSAESFTLTPLAVGYDYWRAALGNRGEPDMQDEAKRRISYRPTRDYGGPLGWTVGRSVAVSGAAASPNSGYHTSPLVAFMLTLFNARLGWWAPNPMTEGIWKRARPKGGFLGCLFSELTGSATINSDFVYLSDGGHFENLGLYELVRRRCKLIIVGDAECDPGYTFQGLGMAIRRCRVDFGVDIEMDPSSIQPDPVTGLSQAHVAFGTIRYPALSDGSGGEMKGLLIYIKASVTGDEPRDVQQYRAENPIFPHESTGDQFYSEAQFESYRRLGQHVAGRVFTPSAHVCMADTIAMSRWKARLRTRDQKDNGHLVEAITGCLGFNKYIKRLQAYWLPPPKVPTARFVHHAEKLMQIWQQAAGHPALAGLDELLSGYKPTNPPPTPESPAKAGESAARHEAYISQSLIQLMENVFLDLDLAYNAEHEDHQGWMKAFRNWAQNEQIRAAWEKSKDTFGERFRTFWEQQIRLSDPESH